MSSEIVKYFFVTKNQSKPRTGAYFWGICMGNEGKGKISMLLRLGGVMLIRRKELMVADCYKVAR